jgi:hypothetical protein
MKQLRYIDYVCSNCGDLCTRFVYFDTEAEKVVDDEQRCDRLFKDMLIEQSVALQDANGPIVYDTDMSNTEASCHGVLVAREMSGIGYMKTISKNNSDFNERERARLEKRQDGHWKRQGRDEAIDKERAFLKKHNAVGGVK